MVSLRPSFGNKLVGTLKISLTSLNNFDRHKDSAPCWDYQSSLQLHRFGQEAGRHSSRWVHSKSFHQNGAAVHQIVWIQASLAKQRRTFLQRLLAECYTNIEKLKDARDAVQRKGSLQSMEPFLARSLCRKIFLLWVGNAKFSNCFSQLGKGKVG